MRAIRMASRLMVCYSVLAGDIYIHTQTLTERAKECRGIQFGSGKRARTHECRNAGMVSINNAPLRNQSFLNNFLRILVNTYAHAANNKIRGESSRIKYA